MWPADGLHGPATCGILDYPAEVAEVRMRAGDVLRILTPGGGGWGRPVHASRALGETTIADGSTRTQT